MATGFMRLLQHEDNAAIAAVIGSVLSEFKAETRVYYDPTTDVEHDLCGPARQTLSRSCALSLAFAPKRGEGASGAYSICNSGI